MTRLISIDLREALSDVSCWGQFYFVVRDGETFESAFSRALLARYFCQDGAAVIFSGDSGGTYKVERASGHVSVSGSWRHGEEAGIDQMRS